MDQPFGLIDKSAVQEDKGKALERNLFVFHYFCAIKKKGNTILKQFVLHFIFCSLFKGQSRFI